MEELGIKKITYTSVDEFCFSLLKGTCFNEYNKDASDKIDKHDKYDYKSEDRGVNNENNDDYNKEIKVRLHKIYDFFECQTSEKIEVGFLHSESKGVLWILLQFVLNKNTITNLFSFLFLSNILEAKTNSVSIYLLILISDFIYFFWQ